MKNDRKRTLRRAASFRRINYSLNESDKIFYDRYEDAVRIFRDTMLAVDLIDDKTLSLDEKIEQTNNEVKRLTRINLIAIHGTEWLKDENSFPPQ